jgi:hypothetical protein
VRTVQNGVNQSCQQASPQDARIDIDLPTLFFSQFPETKDSPVAKELDDRMIPLLQKIAS